jgi:hypothetical protein
LKTRLSIFLVTLSVSLIAQGGFKRKYFLPGSYTSVSRCAIEAPSGDLVIIGLSSDPVGMLDRSFLTVVGTDSNGNFQWEKKYGNAGNRYVDDGRGGAVLSEGDFFYHAVGLKDTSFNAVLVKYNYQGDTLWQRFFRKDSLEVLVPSGLCRSIDGGFLITGVFINKGVGDGETCMLIKANKNGNELWRKKIAKQHPNAQYGMGIVQDSTTKKIVITGYQYIGTSTAWDSFSNILILDSIGNKIFQTTFNNSGGGPFGELVQLRDKKFITCGSWAVGNNQRMGTAVKFDINGNMNWRKFYDMPSIYNGLNSAQELPNGDLLFVGWLDTMSRPPLWYPEVISVRLLRTDKNGNLKWAKDIGSAYADSLSEGPYSLRKTRDGGFVIAVRYPYLQSTHPFSLIKIDSTGCDTTESVCRQRLVDIATHNSEGSQIIIYPNPASTELSIHWGGTTAGNRSLAICDLSGREVYTRDDLIENDVHLDISSFAQGMYFVNLFRNGQKVHSGKLAVIR